MMTTFPWFSARWNECPSVHCIVKSASLLPTSMPIVSLVPASVPVSVPDSVPDSASVPASAACSVCAVPAGAFPAEASGSADLSRTLYQSSANARTATATPHAIRLPRSRRAAESGLSSAHPADEAMSVTFPALSDIASC